MVPAPWGPIQVASTIRGIVAIELLTPTDEFVEALERRMHAPVEAVSSTSDAVTARNLDAATRAVVRFLDGDPGAFDGVALDLEDRPAWDRTVLGAVRRLGRGETASYGEIARRIGRRGAARAVGGAVGRNPVALAIPCHRVIAADGTLGGYGGGWWGSRETRLALKRDLLAREGVLLADDRSGAAAAR